MFYIAFEESDKSFNEFLKESILNPNGIEYFKLLYKASFSILFETFIFIGKSIVSVVKLNFVSLLIIKSKL